MSNTSVTSKPYLLAAIFWIAAVVVFFSPVFFQGKVIAPLDIMDSLLRPWATAEKIQVHNAFTYDAISQYLPYDYSVYQSLRQDGYIGWNPYTHSGTSIVENTMICPGDWRHHLYRFLPFWTAWNTGIILQFTIAGLGMLMLLRDQKIPATHALLGVIAFGFYSQFILWINHRWILGAMCWAPWILWSLFRAKKLGLIIHLPSIAFIALAFRGGHLQACVFVVLMVAIVAFCEATPSVIQKQFRVALRTLAPYTLSGIFAAFLTLDVIVETVPALLEGNKTMPERGFLQTLLALPTLVTSVFPFLLGTPQGIDSMKIFGAVLFTIKFMGAGALILAIMALFNRDAPRIAKTLLIIGIIIPFTPANNWLYSRFTTVFALGGAWLSAWQLYHLSTCSDKKTIKRIIIGFILIIVMWTAVSGAIKLYELPITEKAQELVTAKLPPEKSSRSEWMKERTNQFISSSLIWHPRNVIFISLIGIGFFAAYRILHTDRRKYAWIILVSITTYGELFLFSKTWITFSNKPDTIGLYQEPAWATRLKGEIGQGTVMSYHDWDFDYMQLNTPSAYGMRFVEGYETVTPSRINPYKEPRYDTKRCAVSGISHLVIAPEKDPGTMTGWEKISATKEYVLYRNPEFKGIATATLDSGDITPVPISFDSVNRRTLKVPQGTASVSIAESYNVGWKYSLDGIKWSPVVENDIHGITINLPRVTSEGDTLLKLKYRPAYELYYRPIMGTLAACLIGFSLLRKIKRRNTKPN